jgi:hypothetical protein
MASSKGYEYEKSQANSSSSCLYISSTQQICSLIQPTISAAVLPLLSPSQLPSPNARQPHKPSETFPAALPFTAGYKYQRYPHSSLSLTTTSARLLRVAPYCNKTYNRQLTSLIVQEMSETLSQHSDRLPEPRIMLLTCHAVQLVLAVVILGLDVYGIHYVAYTGLIYSLVIVRLVVPLGHSLLLLTTHPGPLHNPNMRLPPRLAV